MDIRDLIETIRLINEEHGWRDDVGHGPPPRTGPMFPAHLALVHSELSEALEAYRDREWSGIRAGDGKPIGVGPEMADTIIRSLDVCDIWNISIEYELDRVLAFNHTRPYRHGGKVI